MRAGLEDNPFAGMDGWERDDDPPPEATKRQKPAAPPKNDSVTEDAAAVRFAEVYAERLLYCHDTGAWFEWDGAAWKQNRTKLAFHWGAGNSPAV